MQYPGWNRLASILQSRDNFDGPLDVTADYLIGIGTLIAGVAAIISAVATIQGNRRVQKVQTHLRRQDRALGLDTTPEPGDPNGA